VGATALVVAMVDAGLRPGSAVQLASPLKALRTVAADVECKALLPLADGGSRSAVAIQRHYLEQAEAHASDHFMPPWAGEVCRRWHAMLDLLEGAPESVETTLDWAMKLALYTDQVRCRGLRWRSLSGWNAVITRLNELVTRSGAQFLDVDFHIGPHNPMLEDVAAMTPWLRERGLRWGDLGAYTKLLAEMCEIDTRFGQLGDKGIFQSLDRAGLLTHHMPGVDNIEHAIHNPPAIGRARIRGEAVRRLAGQNGRAQCDWQFVWDKHLSRVLDLSDPFATEERWRDNGPDIDDTLRRIFALRR
jgi:hypothetical protein